MSTLTITKRNYVNGIRNYTVLIIFILVVSGVYGFWQYQKLAGVQAALAKESELLLTMQGESNRLTSKYAEIKKVFDQKFAAVLDALEYVLPPTDMYQNLTRLFDQFSQENNLPNNPFFISDLRFALTYPDPAKEYSVLPVTMNISTTKENFLKFLKFVENSGMLESKTRLMEIRSISLNFTSQNSAQASPPLLNVAVALSAYFEKSATTPKK